MLDAAIAAYLALGGDAAEAVAYGQIPNILLNLKNLNDGATDKLGGVIRRSTARSSSPAS